MQVLYHQDTEESIYKIHIMDQSNELNHLSNSNGQNSPLDMSLLKCIFYSLLSFAVYMNVSHAIPRKKESSGKNLRQYFPI